MHYNNSLYLGNNELAHHEYNIFIQINCFTIKFMPPPTLASNQNPDRCEVLQKFLTIIINYTPKVTHRSIIIRSA